MTAVMYASASWGEWDVSPQTIALLTGTILPLVVGFVTDWDASPRLKALSLAALAAVAGYLTNVATESGRVEFWPVVGTALLAAAAAWGSHQSLWKPTGTTAKVQATGLHVGAAHGPQEHP